MRQTRKNEVQEEMLMKLMKKHPDMAKGAGGKEMKETYDVLWEQFAHKLNAHGPPTKDGYNWRRSWFDGIRYIRKKIKYVHEKSSGSSCCRVHLNGVEQEIAKLCGLYEELENQNGVDDSQWSIFIEEENDGEQAAKRLCISSDQNDGDIYIMSEDSLQDDDLAQPFPLKITENNSTKTIQEDNSTDKQNNQYKKITVNLCLDRIDRNLVSLCKLQEELNNERKRHNKVMEELTRESNMIKMRKLELQELQFKREQERLQHKKGK
ncbi:uncharacterized protein LOC142237980 [Haematobia irritans]|uniref:uncharacterized protein LOC142237980 n=1 Tax=Haematobia irritans TaxID=7368 RepID=UPI003F50AC8D